MMKTRTKIPMKFYAAVKKNQNIYKKMDATTNYSVKQNKPN